MGFSKICTWVQICRYDTFETSAADEPQGSLRELALTSGSLSDELRSAVFKSIDVPDDGSRILKIRRSGDNHLIPLSTLLNGSDRDKPFIIDVVRVHQFCPVESRTIPPGYIDALRASFSKLETRILLAEKSLPEVTTARINAVEDATSQLANCVSFLDRRLDELAPPDWRSRVCSDVRGTIGNAERPLAEATFDD